MKLEPGLPRGLQDLGGRRRRVSGCRRVGHHVLAEDSCPRLPDPAGDREDHVSGGRNPHAATRSPRARAFHTPGRQLARDVGRVHDAPRCRQSTSGISGRRTGRTDSSRGHTDWRSNRTAHGTAAQQASAERHHPGQFGVEVADVAGEVQMHQPGRAGPRWMPSRRCPPASANTIQRSTSSRSTSYRPVVSLQTVRRSVSGTSIVTRSNRVAGAGSWVRGHGDLRRSSRTWSSTLAPASRSAGFGELGDVVARAR